MKKILTLSLFMVLLGCAKERTTKFYSTQGQVKVGTPITSVLTNEDYEKQQEIKKNQAEAKPYIHPENALLMSEDFDQEDLAILFKSYEAPEVQLPKPEGVICEYIPQLRIQKTLGRLSCTKQSPIVSDEAVIKSATRYSCSVDPSPAIELAVSDRLIYEGLSLTEEEDTHGYENTRTFVKKAGRFYCEKIIKIPSGDIRYHCSVQMLFIGIK